MNKSLLNNKDLENLKPLSIVANFVLGPIM
jgi:hypothetical protein